MQFAHVRDTIRPSAAPTGRPVGRCLARAIYLVLSRRAIYRLTRSIFIIKFSYKWARGVGQHFSLRVSSKVRATSIRLVLSPAACFPRFSTRATLMKCQAAWCFRDWCMRALIKIIYFWWSTRECFSLESNVWAARGRHAQLHFY